MDGLPDCRRAYLLLQPDHRRVFLGASTRDGGSGVGSGRWCLGRSLCCTRCRGGSTCTAAAVRGCIAADAGCRRGSQSAAATVGSALRATLCLVPTAAATAAAVPAGCSRSTASGECCIWYGSAKPERKHGGANCICDEMQRRSGNGGDDQERCFGRRPEEGPQELANKVAPGQESGTGRGRQDAVPVPCRQEKLVPERSRCRRRWLGGSARGKCRLAARSWAGGLR
mmetsp:Transcript_68015/g.159484  ORF Transcript_68015/g.159484 Transcript_68015/m.159484 type:complete len:227 (+) Transcript_68015:625-1305(+)